MNSSDAEKFVLEKITVNRADIAAAKAFLITAINETENRTTSLVERWVASTSVDYPDPVHIKNANTEEDLKKVARGLSLKLAGFYAIWEMIHSGYLTPAGSISADEFTVGYTTVIAGSGESGGMRFSEVKYSYPDRVLKTVESSRRALLTDGDMYLQDINLPDLHPGIKEALGEAARCFRHDLFTGTVVMLGSAFEGVWIELGRTLVQACQGTSRADKLQKALDFSQRGIGYLVKQIIETCENHGEARSLVDKANVTLEDLRTAALWWDTVREARNVLHWEVKSTIANSFEKVSLLMLSAVSQLRTLWKIRAEAVNSRI